MGSVVTAHRAPGILRRIPRLLGGSAVTCMLVAAPPTLSISMRA
jgi:hypothetical protein